MRTIAILSVLTLVAGIAPAAPYTREYLSTAVLLFTAALAGLLASCLVIGWRLSDLRALTHVSKGAPASGPIPATWPALRPVRSLSIEHPGAAAHGGPAAVSLSPSWSAAPTSNESSASGRVALSDLAISAPQAEPAGVGPRSNGSSPSRAAPNGATRRESFGVPL